MANFYGHKRFKLAFCTMLRAPSTVTHNVQMPRLTANY